MILATPRGFCAGVERAIEIVERVLQQCGTPVYVRHEVVHNKYVVDNLKAKGAIFIEELTEVPDNATLVFSAHGVSQKIRDDAQRRGLRIFDATCPLVTKVHTEVIRMHRQGFEIIMIGHQGHPEVEGTMGQISDHIHLVSSVEDVATLTLSQPDKVSYVTQTTLSLDDARTIIAALRVRFPLLSGPKKNDICYATQNRQDAVKHLAETVDAIFVVGSVNSSNSNRLREVAEIKGVSAWLIDDADDIQPQWLENKARIGVTAGASAPEILVQNVVKRLQALGMKHIQTLNGAEEHVVFSLPRALLQSAPDQE